MSSPPASASPLKGGSSLTTRTLAAATAYHHRARPGYHYSTSAIALGCRSSFGSTSSAGYISGAAVNQRRRTLTSESTPAGDAGGSCFVPVHNIDEISEDSPDEHSHELNGDEEDGDDIYFDDGDGGGDSDGYVTEEENLPVPVMAVTGDCSEAVAAAVSEDGTKATGSLEMRLSRRIARSGMASRREAER